MTGAPEQVLRSSKEPRPDLEKALAGETAKGRRVIAIAVKKVTKEQADAPWDELEKGVDVLGIVGIEDPPRKGVRQTIEAAREAGIRTIMVTGDHPRTAAFIAGEVGIPNERVVTGADMAKMSDEELKKKSRKSRCSPGRRPRTSTGS